MTFESDGAIGLYPHVELVLRTESRGSSREAAAQWSAVASRVLADDACRPPLDNWSDFGPLDATACHVGRGVIIVGRAREAAGPSRVCHKASVEPSSSVRGAV